LKKIKFMAGSHDSAIKLIPPAPAKTFVPDWYRKAERFIGGKMDLNESGVNKDLKLCVPFLDALTSGYCIELPCDIYVKRNSTDVVFFWHEKPEPVEMRSKQMATTLPRPSGHDKDLYAWVSEWATITPDGYSALFTHPLNRFDLPFTTTSGIVDSDKYFAAGQIPFFLKEGFEGVIEAGTPIVQIIPFKRDNWENETLPYNEEFLTKTKYSIQRLLFGGYKKLLWQKKDFR
jgi:hypothetical protein